jgi:hypothetical protein
MPDICEHERIITDLFDKIQLLNIGPYNYWYTYLEEAVYCFLKKYYIASILVSSATVETVLFWEHLREEHKTLKGAVRIPEKTPPLSELFDYFKETAIPLRLLLDSNEFEFFKQSGSIRDAKARRKAFNNLSFIRTRNKFAHGEIFEITACLKLEQFKKIGKDFTEPYLKTDELESIPYSQLYRTLCFMNELLELKIQKRI